MRTQRAALGDEQGLGGGGGGASAASHYVAASGGCGGGDAGALAALASQAETPHERLLVAKLLEARGIMSEQERALKMAVGALATGRGGDGDGSLGGGTR